MSGFCASPPERISTPLSSAALEISSLCPFPLVLEATARRESHPLESVTVLPHVGARRLALCHLLTSRRSRWPPAYRRTPCCSPGGLFTFIPYILIAVCRPKRIFVLLLLAPSLAGKINSRYARRHLALILVGISRRIAKRVGYSAGRQSAGSNGAATPATGSSLGAANNCTGYCVHDAAARAAFVALGVEFGGGGNGAGCGASCC